MKFANIKKSLKKNAPTMMVVGGIGCVIGGTVLACKKTIKMKEIVDDTKEQIEDANAKLTAVNPEDTEYTEKDNRKEVSKIYGKAAVKTIKNYSLPVAIGAAGISMILGGHKILKKRYTTLAAAYVTLETSYEAYRGRVRAKIGEKEEFKLYHNIETEETEVTENGKKKKIKKDVIKDPSMYDVIFCRSTSSYSHGDIEYDTLLVSKCEEVLNQRLTNNVRTKKGKKFIFLNEAYKELGLAPTKAGQVVGWKHDMKDESIDSYISLDVFPAKDPETGDDALGITFNVDGAILDILED